MIADDKFSFQLELLRDEISRIQIKIAEYDDLSFKVKGWAITIWTAILGFAINQESVLYFMAAIPVLLAFWFLDTYFKSYQQRSMARMGYIEDFLNNSSNESKSNLTEAFNRRSFDSFIVFDPIGRQTRKVDEEFGRRYLEKIMFKRCFWIRNVRLLYMSLIVISLLGAAVMIIIKEAGIDA